LLTCTRGRATEAIACRFGLSRVEQLDDPAGADEPIVLSRRLLARLSGDDDLGIPELTSARDLRLVERIAASFPRLGGESGWNAKFGRELNATDDRGRFRQFTGRHGVRPVIEGKQVDVFRVAPGACRFELRPGVSTPRVLSRARLAYRDVASATNRLTLIAAIIPAHAVTTHTVFCLKTLLPIRDQHVLCALLNSFVANYLVRLRVNTHVTVSLVSRLPVPFLTPQHPAYSQLAALSCTIATAAAPVEDLPEYRELQALAAAVYGLSVTEFEHVLATFPLVDPALRAEALTRFVGLARQR
jgi:hypothetical protein